MNGGKLFYIVWNKWWINKRESIEYLWEKMGSSFKVRFLLKKENWGLFTLKISLVLGKNIEEIFID